MTNNKADEFSAEQQELAEIGKIFSHPARIAIIQLLAVKKEIKTGDISTFLPLSRTTVSQHLKELKNAGIIQGNIEGLKIHCCINVERLTEIRNKYLILLDNTINDCCSTCNC